MKPFFFLLLSYFAANSALAQSSMVFQREILTIIAKEEPQIINENNEQTSQAAETAPREPIRFYTEMRPEQVLQMNWLLALNRVDEQNTLTVLFDPPVYDSIQPQAMQTPLDILLVTPEGVISQIMPNLVLAQLTKPIESETPTRARIILKGGAAKALGIAPGDNIQHNAFTPAPTVLK